VNDGDIGFTERMWGVSTEKPGRGLECHSIITSRLLGQFLSPPPCHRLSHHPADPRNNYTSYLTKPLRPRRSRLKQLVLHRAVWCYRNVQCSNSVAMHVFYATELYVHSNLVCSVQAAYVPYKANGVPKTLNRLSVRRHDYIVKQSSFSVRTLIRDPLSRCHKLSRSTWPLFPSPSVT